jgi:hypothetical protein
MLLVWRLLLPSLIFFKPEYYLEPVNGKLMPEDEDETFSGDTTNVNDIFPPHDGRSVSSTLPPATATFALAKHSFSK